MEFEGHKQTVLDTNYRSLSNIVEFNNEFFKAAAQVLDSMDGAGEDGPMSGIYADVAQKVAKKNKPGGNVRLTFCPKDQELQEVLNGIGNAQEAGARLSEIAVLVRSNASGESVANFLIENGIPVVTDDSLKVKNALTVRRLVSLMSYMDNPQDTVAGYLAGMLEVKLPDGCTSLTDIAESLFRSICEGDKDQVWKGELLHIQSFMDCVQDYVSSNGNSLRGFLRHWDEKDPSISSPSSGDSVRVMTIHKSKGLDFPYVILPFAENITLYKADSHWCAPALEGTALEGVAEGVYDVSLSSASASTLFADEYAKENFLQHVDNMNTIYVAMTRAALGMHIIAKTPPAKCIDAVDNGVLPEFKDFSQILYWFVSSVTLFSDIAHGCEDDVMWFEKGEMVNFPSLRKEDAGLVETFPIAEGGEFPSIPLNPSALSEDDTDVRERGRLKFSADSLDFFMEEQSGVSASNRVRGVVLHDILAQVKVISDIPSAVRNAQLAGLLTEDEAQTALEHLTDAVSRVDDRGWFRDNPDALYNETSVIDTDGSVYRPDRVVVDGSSVQIIDYKFGDHRRSYERQVTRYMDMWRRMGYSEVSGFLWYVDSGNVVELR
jgi:ATP-dependent exoDNAse (exonuclease V) beta subunit